MSICENLRKINDLLPQNVRLLAVSKFHPSESVIEAVNAGQLCFGENRVQEAGAKFDEVRAALPDKKIELHIIGSLQRNKVKEAVRIAQVIESVDRIELLKEIEKQCSKLEKTIEVYFELHTGEESKSGFESEESLFEVLDYIKDGNAPHVVPKGLMTMAPNTDEESLIRKSFQKLNEVFDNVKNKYPQFPFTEKSMGMSGDWKIAVEEGSTEVRIGTAIFGKRS